MATLPASLSGFSARISELKTQHVRLAILLLAGLLVWLAASLAGSGLSRLEAQADALAWSSAPDTTPEERLLVVAIDEKSLEQFGSWPWSRSTMALLSESLKQQKVALQLYDIVFPEAKDGDQEFIQALQAAPAVLAQVPALQSDQRVATGLLTHPMAGVSCNQFASAFSFIGNHQGFAAIPTGHISPVVDSDGAIRKTPLMICVEGKAYPAMAVTALQQALQLSELNGVMSPGEGFLAPAYQFHLRQYPGLNIPTDAQGNIRVSFAKAPEAFTVISAADVINGSVEPDLLDGVMAIVGYTAFGLADIVPTPFNGAAAGVEVQARIIASVLDDAVPYQPKTAWLLQLLSMVVCAGILLLLNTWKSEKFAVLGLFTGVVLLPVLAVSLHMQTLLMSNLWLGWLPAAGFSVLASGMLVAHEFARVRMERNRVLTNLSSYMSADVAQEIAYSLPNSNIQARRQSVTLLSADLRNFSAYSESRLPEESAAILHFFFVKAAEIVEAHHGRVHEFKGDGLIAMWDDALEGSAQQALAAALDMQQQIQGILPETAPQGLEPLALGIGIEQGPVLIGSIGPAQRRAHALLGETVTITLRIQELTADLAQPVLIGSQAARHLQGANLESQGSFLLNGLRSPHTLFAPMAASGVAQPALVLHMGGKH